MFFVCRVHVLALLALFLFSVGLLSNLPYLGRMSYTDLWILQLIVQHLPPLAPLSPLKQLDHSIIQADAAAPPPPPPPRNTTTQPHVPSSLPPLYLLHLSRYDGW